MFSPLGLQNEPFDIDFYPSPKADPAKKITLMQDSVGMKDFFVREIQGEWMKIQECIDYGPLYAEDAIVDEEGWEKISKLSEKESHLLDSLEKGRQDPHTPDGVLLQVRLQHIANTSTQKQGFPIPQRRGGEAFLI